jgi:hypothetical protein
VDWNLYTDRHTHPSSSYCVEFVAYERRDGGWDVFAYEEQGACPELEEARVDAEHIFLAHIRSSGEIDGVAETVMESLGDPYHRAVFYHEKGSRKTIGKLYTHLQRAGAKHMWVRSVSDGDWELVLRRKDFPLAEAFIASNV